VNQQILQPTFDSSPLDKIFPSRTEVRVSAIPKAMEDTYKELERLVDEQPEFMAGQLNYDRMAAVLHRRAPEVPIDLPTIPVPIREYLFEEEKLPGSFQSGTASPTTEKLLHEARRLGCWHESIAIPTFLSPQFVVSNHEKDRLIFDLRGLNRWTTERSFELDSLFDLPLHLSRSRFISKLDLRSGFWQVPTEDSDLFGFRLSGSPGRYGIWKVLPFGWSQAPRVFQQITSCFVRAWRARGIDCGVYLDDFVWGAATLSQHLEWTQIIIADLLAAGLALSAKKTELRPHDSLTYLGVTVDAEHRQFSIPASKRSKLTTFAQAALDDGNTLQAELQTFLGRAAFTRLVCPCMGFFVSHLSRLIDLNAPGARRVVIDDGAREELQFWVDHGDRLLRRPRPWHTAAQTRAWMRPSRTPLATAVADAVLRQDASETGVGLCFESTTDGGRTYRSEPFPDFILRWLKDGDPRASSTSRELYGVARNLDTADGLRPGTTVRLVVDNTAAVLTARGTVPTAGTAWAARYLLSIAERRGILLQTEWAPREEMSDVDAGSRLDSQDLARSTPPGSWMDATFTTLWGGQPPTTDLFADIGNHVAERFFSRFPQPTSRGEAFSSPWTGARLWGFPPFTLTRLTAARAANGSWERHQLCLLLPDLPTTRAALHGWRVLPGPTRLLAPPDFTREYDTTVTLALFASP
jgi:hypothetical protein